LNKLLPLLAFSILLLVPVGAQDVYGDTVVTEFPIIITCTTPPTQQLCEPLFSANVETKSELSVQYAVTGHCSSIRVHVFLDGNFVTTSEFFGWVNTIPPPPFDNLPLMTPIIDLGPVTPGIHQVSLQGEGQVSGCNSGGLGVWTGTLTTFTDTIPPLSCGPKTIVNIDDNQCVPDLSKVCGQGTFPDFNALMCFGLAMETVGGALLDINTASLLVAAIGTNPVITGLVAVTIAGVAGQAIWFVHRRRKSENS